MFSSSQLTLFFQTSCNIAVGDFNLFIDESPVQFEIVQNQLIVTTDLTVGVHLLKIRSCSNKRIEFTDVQLDGASVRHSLYLSYLETNDKKIQPCTAFWETGQVWSLPFANPMSYWIQCVWNNLEVNIFGKDLQQEYNIFYPSKKIKLPGTFSTIVRDFFSYDFDFTVVPNRMTSLREHPIIPLNLDLTNAGDLVREYESVKSLLAESNKIRKQFAQNQYNILEDRSWNPGGWYFVTFYGYNANKEAHDYLISKDLVPLVWKQIQTWNIQDYVTISIIGLEPGGYAAPHIDPSLFSQVNSYDYDGCCQLYIPLDVPVDNYIKLAGAGLVDTSHATAINITGYTHCAVNDSNRRRYVMAIRCNIEKNKHLIDRSFLDNLL